jgi:hypothetical protein
MENPKEVSELKIEQAPAGEAPLEITFQDDLDCTDDRLLGDLQKLREAKANAASLGVIGPETRGNGKVQASILFTEPYLKAQRKMQEAFVASLTDADHIVSCLPSVAVCKATPKSKKPFPPEEVFSLLHTVPVGKEGTNTPGNPVCFYNPSPTDHVTIHYLDTSGFTLDLSKAKGTVSPALYQYACKALIEKLPRKELVLKPHGAFMARGNDFLFHIHEPEAILVTAIFERGSKRMKYKDYWIKALAKKGTIPTAASRKECIYPTSVDADKEFAKEKEADITTSMFQVAAEVNVPWLTAGKTLASPKVKTASAAPSAPADLDSLIERYNKDKAEIESLPPHAWHAVNSEGCDKKVQLLKTQSDLTNFEARLVALESHIKHSKDKLTVLESLQVNMEEAAKIIERLKSRTLSPKSTKTFETQSMVYNKYSSHDAYWLSEKAMREIPEMLTKLKNVFNGGAVKSPLRSLELIEPDVTILEPIHMKHEEFDQLGKRFNPQEYTKLRRECDPYKSNPLFGKMVDITVNYMRAIYQARFNKEAFEKLDLAPFIAYSSSLNHYVKSNPAKRQSKYEDIVLDLPDEHSVCKCKSCEKSGQREFYEKQCQSCYGTEGMGWVIAQVEKKFTKEVIKNDSYLPVLIARYNGLAKELTQDKIAEITWIEGEFDRLYQEKHPDEPLFSDGEEDDDEGEDLTRLDQGGIGFDDEEEEDEENDEDFEIVRGFIKADNEDVGNVSGYEDEDDDDDEDEESSPPPKKKNKEKKRARDEEEEDGKIPYAHLVQVIDLHDRVPVPSVLKKLRKAARDKDMALLDAELKLLGRPTELFIIAFEHNKNWKEMEEHTFIDKDAAETKLESLSLMMPTRSFKIVTKTV